MSKLSTAIEIVKSNPGDKKATLSAIETQLGVTRANASVYLFKAMKALEDQPSNVVTETPSQPEEPEPVYELSDEDHLEYAKDMSERKSNGLSQMSIQEWKSMTENLKALA